MIIERSELEDFMAVLAKHGLSEEDFELSSREDPLPAGKVSPVTGNVTVTSKKTGTERTCRGGHGTACVVEFEKDLGAGRFS